jgi:hypothetical protein
VHRLAENGCASCPTTQEYQVLLKDPMLARLIVHFVWMCYVIQAHPEFHKLSEGVDFDAGPSASPSLALVCSVAQIQRRTNELVAEYIARFQVGPPTVVDTSW